MFYRIGRYPETLPGSARHAGPQFVEVREAPFIGVLAGHYFFGAMGGRKIHDFRRNAQIGLRGVEHLDEGRHQGFGGLLCHHADAPGCQAYERAYRVDADAFDKGLEQACVEVVVSLFGHATDGF